MTTKIVATTLTWGVLLAASVFVQAVAPRQQPGNQPSAIDQPSSASQRALLDRYCVSCHNARTKTAGLQLDSLDVTNVGHSAPDWEKVVRKLRGGLMPPPGMPRPDAATSDAFRRWLEGQLDTAAASHPTWAARKHFTASIEPNTPM